MQAMTTVVGWSVIGSLTAQLVQPLPSASLLLVRAAAISPISARTAIRVFIGILRFGRTEPKPTASPRLVTADTGEPVL
jgi:hypothetical protein